MKPEIRSATEADLNAIVAVVQAAFAEYAGRLDPPSSAETKTVASTRAELADGGALFATIEQQIVGSVFYHVRPNHLYLDRLAVLPNVRGQGLARLLIAAVENQAIALNRPAVRLSVRLALVANRQFYERLGYHFLADGTHAGYTTPTYVVLEKRLSTT